MGWAWTFRKRGIAKFENYVKEKGVKKNVLPHAYTQLYRKFLHGSICLMKEKSLETAIHRHQGTRLMSSPNGPFPILFLDGGHNLFFGFSRFIVRILFNNITSLLRINSFVWIVSQNRNFHLIINLISCLVLNFDFFSNL